MLASVRHGIGHGWFIALCVAMSAGLSACSSAPKADAAQQEKQALDDKVNAKLAAADVALKAGQTDAAMAALDDAIKLDPSSKLPWLKKSQVHFDKRQYGVAITEAQEVLQRDVQDNTARSILAVSGLRVSAEALEQLRKANEVKGSARTEAESVARIIREALGEPILEAAPAVTGDARPEPARPVSTARPAARVAARPLTPASAAVPATSAPASTGGRPAAVVASTNGGTSTSTATGAAAPARPKPIQVPPPAAGNGRSNPFGALQ